jgi:ABC-type ATPase involved in cell division
MDTAREWLTWSFSPTLGAMLFTLLLALSLPIIFHLILYRQSTAIVVPSFVLLGPSGAGKTTLLTLVRLKGLQAHNKATNYVHSWNAAHRLLHTLRRLPRLSPAPYLLASRLNLRNIALRMILPRKSARSK